MINLQLDADEGILLQTTDIERYGKREDVLDELVLTNKNLIYSYEYKPGMFSKKENRVEKIPLDKIKVINGKVQLMRIEDHDDYGDVLQLLYIDGSREYFSFYNPKKEIPKWINAINYAITGDDTPIVEEPVENKRKGLFSSIKKEKIEKKADVAVEVNVFADKMDSAVQRIDNATKQFSDTIKEKSAGQRQATVQTIPTHEPPKETEAILNNCFCTNCGEKLQEGAKFCYGCGAPVGKSVEQIKESSVEQSQINALIRQQEYVGKILKCVYCGAVINYTTVVCPECGMRITGARVLNSLQDFKNQLMAIEATRKKSGFGMFSIYSPADPADKQKLALIQNYPIPNTVDDILEFMLLAVSNIDVKMSKKTWMNNSSANLGVMAGEMPRMISDAWVAKMQQLYQKAEILFPNDPTFFNIQKIYLDKMAELKVKVK